MTESLATQPWLSFLTFLPLFGALVIALRRAMTKKDANGGIDPQEQEQVDAVARRVAMLATLAALALSVFVYFAFLRHCKWRLSARRAGGLAWRRHQLQNGRRRNLGVIRLTDDLYNAHLHSRILALDQNTRCRLHDQLFDHGNIDHWCFLRP